MKVWMRSELRDFIRDSLTGPRFLQRGLYRQQAVLSLIDGHFCGRFEACNKIFALLMLELWYQRFVDTRRELLAASC